MALASGTDIEAAMGSLMSVHKSKKLPGPVRAALSDYFRRAPHLRAVRRNASTVVCPTTTAVDAAEVAALFALTDGGNNYLFVLCIVWAVPLAWLFFLV